MRSTSVCVCVCGDRVRVRGSSGGNQRRYMAAAHCDRLINEMRLNGLVWDRERARALTAAGTGQRTADSGELRRKRLARRRHLFACSRARARAVRVIWAHKHFSPQQKGCLSMARTHWITHPIIGMERRLRADELACMCNR